MLKVFIWIENFYKYCPFSTYMQSYTELHFKNKFTIYYIWLVVTLKLFYNSYVY